ncbi:UNVERIFIED_CONTAM: Embryogenesis-associated protein [Sesamum angustifolium]|uniref:Embryogenesis-associated protein n=1 Tax=Sesamum angustifolium TaxID=2727405 RepID=A0AAW2M888_9LAMI
MVGAYASFGCATLCPPLSATYLIFPLLSPPPKPQFSGSGALPPTIPGPNARLLQQEPPFTRNHRWSREDIPSRIEDLSSSLRSLSVYWLELPCLTIFSAFFRSLPDVRFRRECLRTRDDGAVASTGYLAMIATCLLILRSHFAGLTGGSEDTYVRHMLLRARSKGWRVVVFNSRGCGNSPVTTAQFYSASFLGDISEVVSMLATHPSANLYAVGWSLGANILVRYVGQESFSCPLAGAISLCNPFNLIIADEDFRKGFNIVYDKALANALCKIFRRHALLFEDIGGEFNIPLAANAKSVREFDDGLTRVSFGFKSVDDYYSNSSSSDSIKNVSIPLLCIQAENDPIAPSRGIPREDIKKNPNCMLIVTPKGGHLGWVAGGEAPLGAPWTDPIVMDFLEHLEQARVSSFVTTSTSLEDANVTGPLHQVEDYSRPSSRCSISVPSSVSKVRHLSLF